MTRSLPLCLTFSVSLLALAACGEDQGPTQPEAAGTPAAVAASLALASNTWTAKAPYPFLFGSLGLSAGVFPNPAGQSIAYTFGGTGDEGGTGVSIRAYNVATNSWTTMGYEPRVYGFFMNGAGRIGSQLYFSGGRFSYQIGEEGSRATFAYDPAANLLTRKADMPRYTAEGVSGVIDGRLWVLPGICDDAFWPSPGYCEHKPIRQLYRYDPANNTWVLRKAAPHYHRLAAGGVIDGKFYVAGGLDGFSATANLDVYDPTTDSWRTLAPLPTAGQAVGTALGGKLWVVVASGTGLRAYAYDPGTNTWQTRAAPAWGLAALVRVSLNSQAHLLAVGGFHDGPNPPGEDIPNDNELYTR